MATPVHGQLCRENNRGGIEVIHSSSCVQCPDGAGEVECFQVFPGIRIFFNQFHAWHCEESYEKSDPLQINFCYKRLLSKSRIVKFPEKLPERLHLALWPDVQKEA